MTVHCVEVAAASDVDAQNVKDKIADLKTKYGEKLPKQDAPFSEVTTPDGTTYYRAAFRVTLTDKETEKQDLTDQIEKEADKSASWWRVRWHECDHDEQDRAGCGWNYENSAGTVPQGV